MLSSRQSCHLFIIISLFGLPTYSLHTEYDIRRQCDEVAQCSDGFHMNSDNTTCVPTDPLWNLIYVSKDSIWSLHGKGDNVTSFEKPDYIIQENEDNSLVFLASDVRNKYVYWTNVATGYEGVYKNKIDNTGQPETIVDTGLYLPMGIAYDWITGNVYLVDKKWCLIAVCSMNPTRCAIIIKQASDARISDIALHPNEGIMFWTDEGRNEAIKKSNMDGSDVTTIVSNHLSLPRGITLDEVNSRIYWTDITYDIVESSRFDGSDRRTVTRTSDPFGVDIFGDFVFWTTTRDKKIMSINIFGGNVTTIMDVDEPRSLTVMHITRQPILRENQCETAKCSHICAMSAFKAQCLCPVGMMLANETFCLEKVDSPKLLLVFNNQLLITRVNTIGKDVFDQINFPAEIKAISALVYNPINDSVIISDNASKKIIEYKIGSNDLTVLIDNDLMDVTLIDFDLVGENLFWVDASKQTMEVFSLTTGARRTLMTDYKNVHDILYVADQGRLYYTKASKTGNFEEIHKIVFSHTIKDTVIHRIRNQGKVPVQLAFDRTSNTLIGTLSNATHVTLHYFTTDSEYYWKTSDKGQVYDSVHIKNQLFWVDKSDKVKVLTTFDDDDRFMQFIKINNKGVGNMTSGITKKILTAVDRNISHSNQLRRHQCSLDSPNRKICSHICLPGSVKFLGECWCPTNLILSSDKQTCIEQEQIIISQDENFGADEAKTDGLGEAENAKPENYDKTATASTTMPTLQSKENDSKSFDNYKSKGTRNSVSYSINFSLLAINMIIFIAL